jgi:hypothetical protein
MIDWLKRLLTSINSASGQAAYELGCAQEWPLDYGNDQRLAELLASLSARRGARHSKL